MPILIKPGLNAMAFCSAFEHAVRNIGAKAAFGTGNCVVLYSGPSAAAQKTINETWANNWQRSRNMATRISGRRIDDTPVGQFLSSFNFEDYFSGLYSAGASEIDQAEFIIWAKASSLFMRANFKTVATAVCAADPKRVFRKYEMWAVLQNRKVKTINHRPVQLFRDFYKINPDEAYRLFCLTELLEARKRAIRENTAEAWGDYRERRCFHFQQCRFETGRTSALPEPQKQEQKLQKAQALLANRLAAELVASASLPVARTRRAMPRRMP